VRFSGDAWFGKAMFSESAWFGKAMFSESALFEGATFSGDALFNEATFPQPPTVEGATISGWLVRTDGAEEDPSDQPRPFQPYVPPVMDTDPATDEGAGVRDVPEGDSDPEDPENDPDDRR